MNSSSRFGILPRAAFLVLIVLISIGMKAQVPDNIYFQVTVRDYNNVLLVNRDLSARISIVSQDSEVYYEEKQMVKTNELGMASIEIGSGTNQVGNIADINWDNGDDLHYVRAEFDPEGGNSFTLRIHSRITSVPLALRAKSVGMLDEADSVYLSSVAGNITQEDLGKWNHAVRYRHFPGDVAAGGIVFYVDSTGENGLVASKTEVSVSSNWTDAANYCDTLTISGKNDWYLPSLDELSLLFDSRYQVNRTLGEDQDAGTNGLTADTYWSSTERDSDEAYLFEFDNPGISIKETPASVRAIRKFSGLYDFHNYPWLVLLGPEEELKSNGNVTVILENDDGDVLADEAGKRGTVCRTTPEICLPAKITFKLQTKFNPDASEPPTILRGTGDFRICFGGPPKGESLEDMQESNMGEYEGVQFRIHPHLDESPIRVYTGTESHTCTSIWLRYVNPDKRLDDEGNPITGLASDECQGRGNQCGWERVGLFENGFGLDNLEETLVTIIISESIISISVKDRTWSVDIDDLMANDDDVVGDALRFDQITYMSISHTNTSRGYRTIRISDLKVLPLE